jgi:hypothetical protein
VAAATTTSALYGPAKTNKPLQIACLHVSKDKGRSIGLVFMIRWQAANKARAQSHGSSNASAGRKSAAGLRWAMARYSRNGGID